MSIILAMPGKRENQERLWKRCIVEAGLEPYTQLAFQANSKWHSAYPSDLLGAVDDPSHIAAEQYNHTRYRLDDGFQPKPYAYTYLDYEPQKPHLDGPDSSWGWMKMLDGYDDDDHAMLAQMRRGVQEATDGLPYSIYRTPTLPKDSEPDPAIIKSARESLESCEWVWMHAYPHKPLDRDTIGDWHDHIVRQFGALSKLGRRVIPWVWPSYRLTQTEATIYGAATIKSLGQIPGVNHIGVWVDCDHAVTTDKQMSNLIPILGNLREWAERVVNAGEPQGVE